VTEKRPNFPLKIFEKGGRKKYFAKSGKHEIRLVQRNAEQSKPAPI